MELKIEHLSPYLPYGLKFISGKYWGGENEVQALRAISLEGRPRINLKYCYDDEVYSYYELKDIRPILRPLSEIKDIPEIMDAFSEYDYKNLENTFLVLGSSHNSFYFVNYTQAELIFKHHLDLFGLIDKGLAINVNDLK